MPELRLHPAAGLEDAGLEGRRPATPDGRGGDRRRRQAGLLGSDPGGNGQFALFSVTSYDREDSWDAFGAKELHNLVLAGHYIHQRAAEIMGTDRPPPAPDLSPRERDVLAYLSVGHSRGEAAASLGISEHTFRAYLDAARLKLGAVNTTHAVAMAITRGLIVP